MMNGTQTNDIRMDINNDTIISFEPAKFKTLGKIMRVTSDVLASKIREAYSTVFHDLKGVNLVLNHNNIEVEFYFENNPEEVKDGSIKNLINLMDTSKPSGSGTKNLLAMRNLLQNRVAGHHYEINDETKILLADIMYGNREALLPSNKSAKFWEAHIHEMPPIIDNNMFVKSNNAVRNFVKVTGIDIHKVLRKLYGADMVINTTINDDGKEINSHANAMYEIRFIKYLNNGVPNVMVLHIEQFDVAAADEYARRENPMPGFQQQGFMFW